MLLREKHLAKILSAFFNWEFLSIIISMKLESLKKSLMSIFDQYVFIHTHCHCVSIRWKNPKRKG
jgi:hypothetical protein